MPGSAVRKARALAWALIGLAAAGCDTGQIRGQPREVDDPVDGGTGGGRVDGGSASRYHPEQWADPTMHGPELKLQRQDCRGCHGPDLNGDSGPSCDTCHTPDDPPAWRTTCTFCHGGTDNDTGAPPRNLDGTDGPGRFPGHGAHVTEGLSRARDCTECHAKPVDVLTEGHIFDSTPGSAEIGLAGGLSAAGTYDGERCTNLYCHGNGREATGEVARTDGPMACDSCHPSLDSGEGRIGTMSGRHDDHVEEGLECRECHADTTDDNTSIDDPLVHVDGEPQVVFAAPGMSFEAGARRCSGTCHGEEHDGRTW